MVGSSHRVVSAMASWQTVTVPPADLCECDQHYQALAMISAAHTVLFPPATQPQLTILWPAPGCCQWCNDPTYPSGQCSFAVPQGARWWCNGPILEQGVEECVGGSSGLGVTSHLYVMFSTCFQTTTPGIQRTISHLQDKSENAYLTEKCLMWYGSVVASVLAFLQQSHFYLKCLAA